MSEISEKALDNRARRAAKHAGLAIKKSRWRLDTVDNYGQYILFDPLTNGIEASARFDMSAESSTQIARGERTVGIDSLRKAILDSRAN
jgi:hypothetical protein